MSDFRFSLPFSIRAQDLNEYHVSHDRYFLFFQEARIGYLEMFGYDAAQNNRQSLVIAEASCSYKKELHLNDEIEVKCRISQIRPKSFVMNYKVIHDGDDCALGATTYLCFDYEAKKVVPFPDQLVARIKAYEGLT